MTEVVRCSARKKCGVGFDFDGTSARSEEVIGKIEAGILTEFDIRGDEDFMAQHTGFRFTDSARTICAAQGLGRPLSEMFRIHKGRIAEAYQGGAIQPVEHLEEVLQTLSSSGYPLALTTSQRRTNAEPFLKRYDLLRFFNVCLYKDDVRNGKPHPAIYQKMARRFGLNPRECVAVEDSTPGFKAAKEAKLTLIALEADHNRKTADFSLADYVVKDIREIPPILDSLNHQSSTSSTFFIR